MCSICRIPNWMGCRSMVGRKIMDRNILRVFFKDLLKISQKKIRKWFEEHEYVHYMDEHGERRHIDEMYNNVIPILCFYDDGIKEESIPSWVNDMVS